MKSATILKKSEFIGVGALVQLGGLILGYILFPFGLLPGLVLFIIGNRLAIVRKCSVCFGKVDKQASVCQHCGAEFKKHSGAEYHEYGI
jgi:hypothetical protein